MPTESSQATLAAVDEAVSSKLQKNALIGKGGFGLVYRCKHQSGAEFALKQIHKGRAAKRPLGAQLVAREIAAHEALPPHPFVVAMHRCWQDDRSVYLLLELCACTLFDALFLHGDRNYRLPEASAKVYLASVALALRHLHRAGLVFRDLKMENVLLDPAGQLKLADLGNPKPEPKPKPKPHRKPKPKPKPKPESNPKPNRNPDPNPNPNPNPKARRSGSVTRPASAS